MPVLSFLFRRIQWYHLPDLFGHSGCKVGDFLSPCLSLFQCISFSFTFLFLFLYLFISSSVSLPFSLFLPLCLFVFSLCIIFFLPRCLNFPPFSVLSPVIVIFSRCSLSYLSAFLFIHLSLSLLSLCVFFVLFFPSLLLTFFFLHSAENEETILTLFCSIYRY